MNGQNKQELIQRSQYYTPSKSVTLDAQSGVAPTAEIEFQGLDARQYGVNRILAGGSGMDEVLATAAFNNGRDTKFEDVHLSCLNQLFKHRSLRGAFIIERGTKMFFTVDNTGNSEHPVNIELIGYDDYHLRQKINQYEKNGGNFPEPEFVYLSDTEIAAGATKTNLKINLPDYPLRMYRIAFGTNDTGDNLRIALRQGTTKIKPETYVSQINDEFAAMDIILPQTLQAHTPFELFVTNDDGGNPYQLSMLAECYRI